MKKLAWVFVLAGVAGVGCNQKAAEPEPMGVKGPAQPAAVVPVAVLPAAAPVAIPAEVAQAPKQAAALEPAPDVAPKAAAASVAPRAKVAAPLSVSKRGPSKKSAVSSEL